MMFLSVLVVHVTAVPTITASKVNTSSPTYCVELQNQGQTMPTTLDENSTYTTPSNMTE